MSHVRNEVVAGRKRLGEEGTWEVRVYHIIGSIGLYSLLQATFFFVLLFYWKKTVLFSSLYWRCIFYDGLWG